MSELKVIDVDKMADVRSLSGQFYRKSEVDEVISTIKAERDEYRLNLSCARNEIHNMQIAMRDDIKSITNKDKEIAELEERITDGDKDFEMVNNQNERLIKTVLHHKHKRCLAMAERCKYRMYYLAAVVEQEASKIIPLKAQIQWYEKRERRMYYWKNRWLAIAEKFKEAK